MDISGNKRPNNPASIQSDAAGSSEKPIYQGKEDAHNFVPADEDRDAEPYSRAMQKEPEEGGPEEGGPEDQEDRAGKQDNKDRPEPIEKKDNGGGDEKRPKDDVHKAPESGDKLP